MSEQKHGIEKKIDVVGASTIVKLFALTVV